MAAHWSEVMQKVRAADRDWGLHGALPMGYGIRIEPVSAADAAWGSAGRNNKSGGAKPSRPDSRGDGDIMMLML